MERSLPPLAFLLTIGFGLVAIWLHSLQANTARRNLVSFSSAAAAIWCWSAAALLDSVILVAHLCKANGAFDLKESIVSRCVEGAHLNLVFCGASGAVFSGLFLATIRRGGSISAQ